MALISENNIEFLAKLLKLTFYLRVDVINYQ